MGPSFGGTVAAGAGCSAVVFDASGVGASAGATVGPGDGTASFGGSAGVGGKKSFPHGELVATGENFPARAHHTRTKLERDSENTCRATIFARLAEMPDGTNCAMRSLLAVGAAVCAYCDDSLRVRTLFDCV